MMRCSAPSSRIRRSWTCLLGLSLLFYVGPGTEAAHAKKDKPKPPTLAEEIEQALQVQVDAWNRGDLETFCSIYTPDATFLSPSGISRGRDEVLRRYREKYPNRDIMGMLSLEILEVRPAPAPVARNAPPYGVSVAARWKLERESGEDAEGLTLLVMHRLGDRWYIAQDASM